MDECLRIEICRNFRGLFDYREGDLKGAMTFYNSTKEEILKEIKSKLEEMEVKAP
jgi:hypothetical protein